MARRYKREDQSRNGVRVIVYRRWDDGTVVEADCHCFGNPKRVHSNLHCPFRKAQPARVIREALLHLCGHAELGHVQPGEWSKNFWLVLDGTTHPARTRQDIGYDEDASRPVAAEDLLVASQRIVDGSTVVEELGREVGRPFQQGATAIAAGVFTKEDRRTIQIRGFRVLQLRQVEPMPATTNPSEEAC